MLRSPMIRWILFISVAASLALPLFTTWFIYPASIDLLVKMTEEEAVRLGNHLASNFPIGTDAFKKEHFAPWFGEEIEAFSRNLNILKIEMVSSDGEILYSTDAMDIGEINRERYFHEIVALGTPYTKVVKNVVSLEREEMHSNGYTEEGKNNDRSREDKEMHTDFVETYVPIMNDGRFAGAIEITYDISKSKGALDRLIQRSTYGVVAVTIVLLLAVFLASRRAHQTIQERDRFQEKLSESERKYRELYDNAPDICYSLDREGNFLDCNETGAEKLGYTREELIGKPAQKVFSERSREDFSVDFPKVIQGAPDLYKEREYIRKDGSMFVASVRISSDFDPAEGFLRANSVARDITRQKRMEAALRELAETDSLTNILNRRMIFQFLDLEMERFRRYRKPFSVIMFDIDHFKQVNDTWGHEAGDSVLREMADVVGGALRKSDRLARYGGEEFLVLSPETNAEDVLVLAERIRRVVEQHLFPQVGRVTISVGAKVAAEGEETQDLIKRADEAMYAAKNNGRNRVEIAS